LVQRKAGEKKEDASQEKKELATVSRRRGPASLVPRRSSDLMRDFDRVFERFRRDFEDLLWPSERVFSRAFSMLPMAEVRAPHVDLEDRGKDFVLKAEMPGFRKEDISIQVTDDSVEIQALWAGSMMISRRITSARRGSANRSTGRLGFPRRLKLTLSKRASKTVCWN
jgi:HSP20 family molecular chaperone IbpA